MKKSILFMANNTWVSLKEYINDYKLTSAFFLISVISFMLILLVARNDLKFENGNTAIIFNDNKHIYDLGVSTKYVSSDKDTLTLSFCVKGEDRDKFEYTIETSDNIELLKNLGSKVQTYNPQNSKSILYTYSLSKKRNCILSIFSGNIYGKHSFDKNLHLTIQLGGDTTLVNGKTTIITDKINISNMYPVKYLDKESYGTTYKVPFSKAPTDYTYVAQGQDQSKLYENQLINFDRGILLGILLSIITGVIIDFSFFYDRRRLRNNKQ